MAKQEFLEFKARLAKECGARTASPKTLKYKKDS